MAEMTKDDYVAQMVVKKFLEHYCPRNEFGDWSREKSDTVVVWDRETAARMSAQYGRDSND